MEADVQMHLAEGSLITPLFTLEDEEFFTYWYKAGMTKIYLFEFDEDGNATGRYGVSTVVMPDDEFDFDFD